MRFCAKCTAVLSDFPQATVRCSVMIDSMTKHERHSRIIEALDGGSPVTVQELSPDLGVSEMTIRRDLKELETAGLLRRVYGGAVRHLGRAYEPPFRLRSEADPGPKVAIGRAAAELIERGDAIAIDTGTTCLETVRALREINREHLTVVTASLRVAGEIASTFALEAELRLMVTGGIVRSEELSLVGTAPAMLIRTMHVDKAFIGLGGVDPVKGGTEFNLEDAEVKRGFIESAREVIVVADATKLGRVCLAAVCPVDAIDTLVTDAAADPDQVAALEAAGINVIIAES